MRSRLILRSDWLIAVPERAHLAQLEQFDERGGLVPRVGAGCFSPFGPLGALNHLLFLATH